MRKYDKSDYNEIDTVKSIMSKSLNVIVADVFQLDLDEINMQYDLIRDLNMDHKKKVMLKNLIAEYFDGHELKFNSNSNYTIQDLHNDVVLAHFDI